MKILQLAARENEAAVDDVLRILSCRDATISVENVMKQLHSAVPVRPATEVNVAAVAPHGYDLLLQTVQEATS